MHPKINKCPFILIAALALFFSPIALACNSVIHSFSQSVGSTQGVVTYSCWGTYYCRIEIKKNGILQLDTTIAQGNFKTHAFNYGAGDFTIVVKSFLSTPTSGGGTMPMLQSSSSISASLSAGSATSAGSTIYTYDALGRLKSVVNPSGKTTIYDYDNADNRIRKTVSN